ncbi:hypothetical protein Acr_10g0007700 [Actinidia rufa]|uniref:Reverse transcriptase Ty1/copia-type domain-containing protein n=1 Tax=Actinidia rufa TaxID=165716 RepID=A0A7J0F9N8_9ERIC|nr:hypothetical protein Acr_10g0007700 [Actinidia rufa]
MSGSDVDNMENVIVPPPPPRPDFSLSQHTPGARITCELLNGKNFAAWSRSVRLFLGGKGKSGWFLDTITKPNAIDPKCVQWEINNCTILGWLFNSIELRIYHVFMYHDMVPLLWSSLTKILDGRNLPSISLSASSPLKGGSQLAVLTVSIAINFLMGLKPKFEALRTQIVNTTPMPSIFEAFAMVDGDERRHRLLQLPPPSVTESTIPDQMALAASGSRFSGGRSSSGRAPCSFCGGSKASPRTAAISETSYGSPAAPTAPDFHQLQTQFQNQMEQLQSQFQTQLGSLMQQSSRPNPSPSTAILASGMPTALHVRSSNPSWVLDSGADDHMTGELSLFTSHLSSIDQFVRIADGSAVHDQNLKKIFGRGYEWNGLYYSGDPPDSLPSISLQASVLPSLESLSFSLTSLKLWHARERLLRIRVYFLVLFRCLSPLRWLLLLFLYSRHPPASDPLPQSSPESNNISPISSVLRRYLTRDRRPPDKLGFFNPNATKHSIAQYVSYQGLSDSYRTFIGHVSSTPIPHSVSEALRDPNWVTAMQVEMAALQQNHTWDLVSLLGASKQLGASGYLLLSIRKTELLSAIKLALWLRALPRYQDRIMGATFAPVTKLTTVRVIISLAASYSWPLHQLDIKNAFLNGDLHETIYMDSPPGFRADGEYTGKVCRLRKSLYGLKQSPRAWFSRFSEVVLSLDFIRCQSDQTCFIYRRPNGQCVIISVYVDDIIITGDDASGIERVKQILRKAFDTKDLGPLRYFLGIEVAHSRRGISLSQRKYVLDLLQDTGMIGCRPASSPMDPNFKLSLESGDLLPDATRYQRLVGHLIYLTHTRPDISFVVSVVSQFMHAPRTSHLDAVHHILRYLKTCPDLGLFYTSGEHCGVSCFTDADYAGSKTDSRSTSGFCTFRGTHLLSWKSKKQAVVSRSSAEAEYRAMAQGTCELMWLRSLLTELGFPTAGSSTLFCDNKSAIMLASNSVLYESTKHIKVDVHFIREKVRSEIITPHFVPSSKQAADIFTKSIGPSLLKTSL